ncbi:hypothetical protein [Blastopirellula retiformator]|uniref:Uncharacterized protein n=1 Tax=Blastopirellula retiformator TaxID=2527970 RepID=A0A5C5VJR8_9BACT|nr:hypothetical protein [Blastopirellula retiformator]TWT38311.1 hypothetical protein Enr8_00030 [Blastopirellula retiformator]
MVIDGKTICLETAGIGIIFHSPKFAEHISEEEDYLESNYTTEEQVQSHIQQGTIVGFGTGASGTFILHFHAGYPEEQFLLDCDFKLRLAVKCVGGKLCFRDLYDLMDWFSDCPEEQLLDIEDGIYHVTLCSNRPASGYLGDQQEIHVYLQLLDQFPALAKEGIPTLCT